MIRLNAAQLRKGKGLSIKGKAKKQDIYIVLDNVLDTYNIGSIFRLADAVACKKVYLCGQTETPPNHRIKKASINTTEWVEWEYCESAVEAIAHLQELCASEESKPPWVSTGDPSFGPSEVEIHRGGVRSIQIVAIEQSPKSIPYDKFEYNLPICLVVGHESTGVSKEVLSLADAIVEIPMFGVNISLNVMVSLGIVLYQVIEKA